MSSEQITDEQQLDKALELIGTSRENFESSLMLLREWYRQQPHLPQRYTDKFLRSYLLGCKNSIERAKQKIDNLFFYRSIYPEYLLPYDACNPELEPYFLLRYTSISSKFNEEGNKLIVYKEFNDTTLSMKTDIQIHAAEIETAALQGHTGGYIIIIDVNNMSLKKATQHMTYIKYLNLLQQTTPFRVQKIILLNLNKFAEKTVNIYKSLINEKIKQRIFAFNENEYHKVFDHVPKDMLPSDYGGYDESFETLREKWYRQIRGFDEWFRNVDNAMSDELKRPVHMKRNNEYSYGVEGTFKKLDID